MKIVRLCAVIISSSLFFASVSTQAQDTESGEDLHTFSYVLGVQFGAQIAQQLQQVSGGLDLRSVSVGLMDMLFDRPFKFSEEEMNVANEEAAAELESRNREFAAQISEEGKMFRENYAKRENVIATDSGLLYRVMVDGGSTKKPSLDSSVVVHYRGTLTDGTPFDSSYDRNQPAAFDVQGIIPGWSEALQLMTVGSLWEVVIPPELAYGENGAPPVIPPNATLVFEIELLEVN